MRQGQETSLLGKRLATQLRANVAYRDWLVYYDHGDASVDANVATIKGFVGESVRNLNRVADIDVMVASPDSTAQLLIEIEERPCSPKRILGDVLAALLCNRFAVRVKDQQRLFNIGPTTRLLVAGFVPDHGCRLRRVQKIILPRVQQLEGLSDGISPKNVELLFRGTMAETIEAVPAENCVLVDAVDLAADRQYPSR